MHQHSQEQLNPITTLPFIHTHQPLVHQPLVPRKNACIICAVCFTCSGYYGVDCQCPEAQPRRGKNLPLRGLDSRAKKLLPEDREDYELTLNWLHEYAHKVYRDEDHSVVGLNDLTEVSLCKAHSSTLYRAKKKHQRSVNQAPPSPADSNGTVMDDIKPRLSPNDYPHLPPPTHYSTLHSPENTNASVGDGALAAKIREVSFLQEQQKLRQQEPPESPDFSMMTTSTSVKRKRTLTKLCSQQRLKSSASTPLYSGMNSLLDTSDAPPTPTSHAFMKCTPISPPHQITGSFSSQLPPLHLRTTSSLASLSSSLQEQLYVSPNTYSRFPPCNKSPLLDERLMPKLEERSKVIETVSLKGLSTHYDKSNRYSEDMYYIRNLAITDTYTFRDLVSEIESGPPPPGKRIIISDAKRERIFPLSQAIRSVIQYPDNTHVDLYLSLSEKASIDWSKYT
ncbi:hypothetical protein BDB01DRAFT_807379 [Pilobolus umbonatus]|nr:hypothetical protein BDB01DRAFT_807379 [Pilobolus umbonatus]